MLRKTLSLWAMTALLTACHSLREGDLLFHVPATGNAITAVTPGMTDHVAICLGRDSVIEAIPQGGVVTTPLHTVLSREDGYYVRARVRGVSRRRSATAARRYLGRPYDDLFLPGDSAVYCSELVQLSYVDRRGRAVFQTVPMSFHDASGRITDHWRAFYASRNMDVPEGLPGTNPAELSQRKGVKLSRRKYQ